MSTEALTTNRPQATMCVTWKVLGSLSRGAGGENELIGSD